MKKAATALLILATFLYFGIVKHQSMNTNIEEIWKDVVGYEGRYQVSSLGRIKSLPRKGMRIERLLALASSDGYTHCSLALGYKNSNKTHRVHKLVAIAFIGARKPGQEVNHKNGIRNDNRVENLEWVTHQENILHAFRSGIKSQEGEKCPRSILKEAQVIEIRSLKGTMPYSRIAKMYGVHKSTIKNIVSRRQWDHI